MELCAGRDIPTCHWCRYSRRCLQSTKQSGLYFISSWQSSRANSSPLAFAALCSMKHQIKFIEQCRFFDRLRTFIYFQCLCVSLARVRKKLSALLMFMAVLRETWCRHYLTLCVLGVITSRDFYQNAVLLSFHGWKQVRCSLWRLSMVCATNRRGRHEGTHASMTIPNFSEMLQNYQVYMLS